jgi:hypothetical protein
MQEFGSLDESMRRLIRALVLLHKNVIVSGATSSGKTSVLNALSSFIPEGERVLVIEDASELQLQQRHIVPFETRKADKNGQGEVTIRDLIRSALRLRPDRIVIGEIRGGEALDLLQALNTGHAGSMSTIHANSPLDCLRRIETCALLSGIDIPLSALRSQVASAIDVIVHTARLSDGSRKLVAISEVMPLENGEYRVRDLQKFEVRSIRPDGTIDGGFNVCGEPTFTDQAGIFGLQSFVHTAPGEAHDGAGTRQPLPVGRKLSGEGGGCFAAIGILQSKLHSSFLYGFQNSCRGVYRGAVQLGDALSSNQPGSFSRGTGDDVANDGRCLRHDADLAHGCALPPFGFR